MKKIPLPHGRCVLVDDQDFPWLMQYRWCFTKGYAHRALIRENGKMIREQMHRAILGLERGDIRQCDHVDRNGLNNQRSNLRICEHKENSRNRGLNRNNTSGFKGVTWNKEKQKFRAVINRLKHIGYYNTADEAARAYDEAAVSLHGAFARLNFPCG